MKVLKNAFQEQRHILKIIAIITVGIIIISLPLIFQTRIALDFLINDTVVEANVPEYVGAISNIGIFLWIATATVCLFTAFIAKQQQWQSEIVYFYLYGGFLFLFLGLDDAFLFHESLFPQLTGLPEIVLFFIYLCLIAGFVLLFWRLILKTQYLVIVAALMFLVVGGTIDTVHDIFSDIYHGQLSDGEIIYGEEVADSSFNDNLANRDASWLGNAVDIAEDAPKFLTIISFLVYFSATAAQHLKLNSEFPDFVPDDRVMST